MKRSPRLLIRFRNCVDPGISSTVEELLNDIIRAGATIPHDTEVLHGSPIPSWETSAAHLTFEFRSAVDLKAYEMEAHLCAEDFHAAIDFVTEFARRVDTAIRNDVPEAQ